MFSFIPDDALMLMAGSLAAAALSYSGILTFFLDEESNVLLGIMGVAVFFGVALGVTKYASV